MNACNGFSDRFIQVSRFTPNARPAQNIPWPVYHGRFDVQYYQDSAFAEYGIDFPPTLSQAVIKRKAEYLAGRLAAREALRSAGFDAFSLYNSAERDPQWPQGVTGSVSHTGPHALAVACDKQAWQLRGMGLDIENRVSEKRAQRLWSHILSFPEKTLLEQTALPFPWLVTLAFSVKESLFKALYPTLRRYLSFHACRIIALKPANAQLELQLDPILTLPGRIPGRFTAHYYHLDHHLVTLIGF